MLRLDGLLAGHDGVAHCPAVSLDLHPGEVCAVVGANGTGKSTLLRTVLGHLPPVAGAALLDGHAVDETDPRFRRAVAGVLDDDAYLTELTVAEHVGLVASAHGCDAESAGWLERLGLAPVAHEHPDVLSSGQRRRLLLAAAFVRPSRVLVLDEPEQRLDAAGRDLVRREIRARARAGAAVLLATHDSRLVADATTTLVIADAATPLPASDAIERMRSW
ncbi:multidrug ABC transporter ATP-binding protein [Sediminihabitans luteus]|nr:multidrug ABC transporter ATP-binding protein [Sediminihabitans luteus]